MNRTELDQMIKEIRSARERTLQSLADVEQDEFLLPTTDERWTELRRVLLRFGDHLREHTNQIQGVRSDIDRTPTMAERILARAEESWGQLLAATVGLQDDDLDVIPRKGEWSIRQILEHILRTEIYYQDLINAAREATSKGDN